MNVDETTSAPVVEQDDVSTESITTEMADPRAERIDQYIKDSLVIDDPLEANIGFVNADLMLMAHALRNAVGETLHQSAESLREVAELMPAIENYLKISKQIASMTQLTIKLRGLNGSS